MTKCMKEWLHDHGLTAVAVMDRIGITDRHDQSRILNGKKKAPKELHDTLCRIYGMTEAEYKEAIP